MEIHEAEETALTNFEVYEFLRKSQFDQTALAKDKCLSDLNRTICEVTKYLGSTGASIQNKENIMNLVNALEPFKLMPAEILQIINLRPRQLVEIQVIVEECEERLSEEQLEKLLSIIKEYQPGSQHNDDMGLY